MANRNLGKITKNYPRPDERRDALLKFACQLMYTANLILNPTSAEGIPSFHLDFFMQEITSGAKRFRG